MTRSRFASIAVMALPLAACTVGPNYKPATPGQLGVPDQYSVPADASTRGDFRAWWTQFNDPLLTQLVEQARTQNLDIAQAVARLRQAHEALIQSRAQLLPSVDASAGYSRNFNLAGGTSTITLPDGTVTSITRSSGNSFSVSGDVSYQVGLFGEVRRTVEASKAQYEGSGYDYASVLTSTESEVARNYILARLYQAQLANAKASLAIQDDNLQIAGWRVQAGLVSSVDEEQARASRAQTAASIPSLDQSYNEAVSRLGVLTGQAPGALKAQMATAEPIAVIHAKAWTMTAAEPIPDATIVIDDGRIVSVTPGAPPAAPAPGNRSADHRSPRGVPARSGEHLGPGIRWIPGPRCSASRPEGERGGACPPGPLGAGPGGWDHRFGLFVVGIWMLIGNFAPDRKIRTPRRRISSKAQ